MTTGNLKATFHKDGTISSETSGIPGSKCLAVDGFFSNLGTVKTTTTSEMYESGQATEVQINTSEN